MSQTFKTKTMQYTATIKATGENIKVYKLGQGSSGNGNFYDYDGIPEYAKPSAPKANKKEFSPDELENIKPIVA